MNFVSSPLLNSSPGLRRPFVGSGRRTLWTIGLGLALTGLSFLQPPFAGSEQVLRCLANITPKDALLVAGPDEKILYRKNETRKCIPASTLKVLTALAALEHFGPVYRFQTEFYMDAFRNLKVKGYGDPLLISEVLDELAETLSSKIQSFQTLIMDGSYFSEQIAIPGSNGSTNPYDAPVGAVCANFNTVAFRRDSKGRLVSAEKQTPLVHFARDRINSLDLKRGRHTLLHDSQGAACYAGELLIYFLKKEGVACDGAVRSGNVGPDDTLIHTYTSVFPLETVVQKMLESSSNFMANQLLLALGASMYGPPATLNKGVDAVTGFAKKSLLLDDIRIVEGSGISRQNRLSALDMLAVLRRFRPYRHLLREKDNVYYKTGSLKGVRTRVGYIKNGLGELFDFIIFFNQPHDRMNTTMHCVKDAVSP